MKRNLLTCLLIVVLTLSLACLIACQTTPTYNVTINSGEHGTVSADKTTVEEGDSVTFTVTAEEGYELTSFQVNGSAVQPTNGSYTLENVTADVTASATFSKIVVKYTVTFNYGLGEGTEATRSIEEGTALGELPTATAPEHGVLLGWYNGTTKVDSTFVVNSDVTIKASFLTVDLAVSSKSVVVGLTEGNTESTVTATAKIDGVETTDVTIALSTSNTEVATLTDEGTITVVGDGSIDVIAKYNDTEINRIEGISCRSYAGYTAISTKDDLFAIADNRSGKFYLTADIDCQNKGLYTESYEPLLGIFTGVLDGRGYSIKNFTHDAGFDKGIAIDVQGTIRDIAFLNAFTLSANNNANNALFGKVTGTIENVFVDYTIKSPALYNNAKGAGALASYLDEGAHIRNVVVNLNSSGTKFIDGVGGIAVTANSWTGYAENVLVMTNGKNLTGKILDGLYANEAENGVAEYVTKNCGAYLYTYNLINDTKFAALDSSVWSIRDGAVYFHDMCVLEATPEYDIVYTGGNITHNYETSLPETEKLVVKFLHNTEVMELVPTDKIVLSSSNEDVVKIGFDDDDEVFLEYFGAGSAICTITINEEITISFNVVLNQIIHITSAEDFRTKVPQVLNGGIIVMDNDVDFNGETIKGKNADGETIWSSLGDFSGSFDGQGHTISNLTLGDGWQGGIFTYLTGTIKNVAFVNLNSASTNAHGLIGEINNGGLIENCYVDYVFNANGQQLGDHWFSATICDNLGPNGTIKNTIINIRFKDGFDLVNIDKIGAIAGKAQAWSSMCYDVKAIVNADVTLKLAYGDGSGDSGVQNTWGTAKQYTSFEKLFEGGVGAYTTHWTIDEKGIKFGDTQVISVDEYTLTNGSDVAKIYEDNMEAFEVSVGLRHYLTTITTLPESATVTSSNTDVCTVAIVDGKIVVTPVGKGTATITVTIGDKSATVSVKLIDANSCDIIYEGGDITANFETSGTILDTVIKGQKNGEETAIPETVALSSTDENVAVLVWDDGVLKVKVVGEGSATLSAVCGDGQAISFKVTTTQVYFIASVGDFRTKIANDTAGTYLLTADLDFQGNTHTGTWSGFGNFTGTLDGQGHTISNMCVGDGWNGGLFQWLQGTIKNIAFVNLQQATAAHGLVGGINNGGTIENVYIDYEIPANGVKLDDGWNGGGAFAMTMYDGTIKDCIVNIRFKAGLDLTTLDNVGLLMGKTNAYASNCTNVKVIVNGDVDLELARHEVAANIISSWTTCGQYDSLADLVESGVGSYSKDYWTIDATGITFGSNKVLTVSAE